MDVPDWTTAVSGLIGIGVGLAGTPASHSLTGSVPVRRAGMASGTADLQRDLGGAIMQSILGALLTAGYAAAAGAAIAASGKSISDTPYKDTLNNPTIKDIREFVAGNHKVQPVLRVHLGRRVQLAQSVHKAVPGHKVQQEQWGRQARKDRKV